jgi:hypothetical protein
MRRSPTILMLLVALVAGGLLAVPAVAQDVQRDDPAAEHRRIVEYWTPERMARAIPRLPEVAHHRPGHGGGPPGNGGNGDDNGNGEDTTVTGEPWTAGGDVAVTTGVVFFRLGTTNYRCSGGAVTDGKGNEVSLVVTAGHCLHEGNGGAFATNWTFFPGWDGSPHDDLGTWTATALFTTATWAGSGPLSQRLPEDVGFAVVTNGQEGATLDDALGLASPHDIAFDPPGERIEDGDFYYAFGYPAAQKYDGDELIYCAGPVRDDRDTLDTLSMSCDMTGGSSGGPWFYDFHEGSGTGTVNSVNSYGYRSLRNVMFGPIFGEPEEATYTAATTGVCPVGGGSGDYVCE